MTALLQMSLADGLAAVVGVRYGLGHAYKVFRHTKTYVGSLTFFIIAVALLVVYVQVSNSFLPPLSLVGLAAIATLIENCGVAGLDNLLVPVVVAYGLSLLS